jgi:predicted phosphodiesterase
MKTLVISDLHSNAQAFEAVLKKVRRKRIDQVFCLGDVVGYGAQPNQVLDHLRRLRYQKFYIRGNHDRVAAGIDEGPGFNHVALTAALWTRERLSATNRNFLRNLVQGPVWVDDETLIAHGSPVDEDQYLFNGRDAFVSFQLYPARLIFFGHTHLPSIFRLLPDGRVESKVYRSEATVRLDPGSRYMINPGSVGQPRDRNPDAACALLDRRRQVVQFIRVAYHIAGAQEAIRKAGLPGVLADRLAFGH